jgi:DNA polymerase III sliding clamp (beta) subunit (PCNA family)
MTSVSWSRDILVPRASAQVLRKVIDKADTVDVGVGNGVLFVRDGSDVVSVQLSDAKFPPWRQVVPKQQPHSCTVDASVLAGSLVAVGLSSDERMGRVILRNYDGLRIEASGNGCEASDTITFCGDVPAKGWGCSAANLHEAVRALDGDVVIETDGELDPLVVRHNGEMVAIVMPVRL